MVSIFFLTAVVLLVLGLPIATAIGGASILYILMAGIPPMIMIQRLFSGVNVAALLAIPFFVLAGDLMNSGGIAKRLVRFANACVGRYTGGLATVTIMGCMFFAAISGSGVATAAALGSIMIPEMVKNGYDKKLASAVVATASPIGVIIPPSISYVLYGAITSSSISDLYLAGIPAGIIMGLGLILFSWYLCKKRGYVGTGQKTTAMEKLIAFKDAAWAIGTPVILIGGVFGGIFTPTESAVVAVVYAIFVGLFIYREMSVKDLFKIFFNSAKTTVSIMFIIANATIFAYVLSYERIPQMIVEGFMNISDNKFVILAVINLFLLFAGCVMETTAIMIILVPLLWPVAQALGVNVTHFGIIVTVNTAIGLVTPPFGVCLFTSASVGGVKVEQLAKEVLGFIAVMIISLLIITYIPGSIMFLL